MRYLRLYLSLLFALVMSLPVFSVVAYADELPTDNVKLHLHVNAPGYNTADGGLSFGQVEYHEGDNELKYNTQSQMFNEYVSFTNTFTIVRDDRTMLFKGGKTTRFIMENIRIIYYWMSVDGGTYEAFKNTPNSFAYYFVYTDNTRSDPVYVPYSDIVSENITTFTNTYKFEFTPEKDVYKLVITEWTTTGPSDGSGFQDRTIQAEYGVKDLKFTIDEQSEESGLLGGIIGKLTEVWNTLEYGFANLVKGITELPQRIWSFIENGLKSLFVPSEEDMVLYKDKWDQLLSDRLGAVYQVTHVLTDSWDAVMNADQANTVAFPKVSIPLPDGVVFEFGGYDVKIVPEGFEFLADACKLAFGVVCTWLFVCGLRRKYDEIMGVER